MAGIKTWLSAARLRTLPLALASIGLGSMLAAADGSFSWRVGLLCFGTAVLLQVLSNFANDYGDSVHGADNVVRQGPQRATQSGEISRIGMKTAVWLFVAFCLVAGYILIRNEGWIFHALGLAAIVAAVAYTAGPKPYGYAGLGDFFVFVFFGIVGVAGSYYLHTHQMNLIVLLPAISCGLFCVAVLNVNNIRDITSDRAAGKITIPVRLGEKPARVYHSLLIILGLVAASIYVLVAFRSIYQLLYLITLPLFLKHGLAVFREKDSNKLDPHLKEMALLTLRFSLLFGIGNLL